MDFVNRTLRQAGDLFKTMSPAARITTALLLAVIVISVTFLFRYQSGGPGELLFGGEEIPQSQIAPMEAAFAQKGLAGWTIEGNRIRIPYGQRTPFMAALADADALPPTFDDYGDEAILEGWSVSREGREARQKAAREKQIALVIAQMAGVDRAMVTYSEDKAPGFGRKIERRAGASVKAKGNAHLTSQQVRSIQDTIASMVGGLDRKDVTVLDSNSGISYRPIGEDGNPSATEDPFFQHKRQYEEHYRETILRSLSNIPGVLVEVHATLDPEIDRREQTQKLDKDGFMVDAEEETTTRTTSALAKGGQPGAAPNGVGPNTAGEVTSSETNKTSEEKARSRNQGITGGMITSKRMASYVPQFVAATVKIPNSHFEELWRLRNPTPEGQTPKTPDPNEVRTITTDTIRKIEEEVVQLLPMKPPGEDRYKPVTVSTYDLVAAAAPPAPSMVESATYWLGEWWPTIGVMLLGLISLMMLRGLLKASEGPAPADSALASGSTEAASGSAAAAGENTAALGIAAAADENEPAAPAPKRRRFKAAGPNVRDELAAMVRENPDAAANVLRSWIGEAA